MMNINVFKSKLHVWIRHLGDLFKLSIQNEIYLYDLNITSIKDHGKFLFVAHQECLYVNASCLSVTQRAWCHAGS